jgi:isopentenyl diphosphate isomerase/L-lactate dehydrogenase-like FMN-dependent dehydrogenase
MGRNDGTVDARRRAFLRYLAASPLCSAFAASGAALAAGDVGERVAGPADAIDIFDLETTAGEIMPAAHWGYLATGTYGDGTLRANRTAFDKYYLRSRRLVDVSGIDTRINLLGQEWPSPIVMCPVGSQQAFHADGELATARAAHRMNALQILSSVTSTAVEDVVEARGDSIWYQLYPTGRWDVARRLLQRAEAAGCPAVVLTVDLPAGGLGRNTLARAVRQDSRDCASCHENPEIAGREKPMYAGMQLTEEDISQAALTWEFLDRMRDATDMKILVKGIVTAEDAERCLDYSVDGIVVSNHGGRADDSGRGAVESLEEVAAAVGGRTTIIMDSGIRRGTDIVKTLALGANAVAVGRPYIWGLGAFGEAGVYRALEILQSELVMTMQFTGTPTLASISPEHVARYR